MPVQYNRSAEKVAAIQAVWETYRSIFTARGIDVASWLDDLSQQALRLAQQAGAEGCFESLCKAGCHPKSLAIEMALFHPLRSIDEKWKSLAGTARQRKQRILAIHKATAALEEMLVSLQNVTIEDGSFGPFNMNALMRAPRKPIVLLDNHLPHDMATDPLDIETTIRALKNHASILQAFELSQSSTDSGDGFAKYFFSAYVIRATGRFHDAEVSNLISASIGVFYDVTAHRMWRVRNYARIDRRASSYADMFADLSIVFGT